jgi:hypothetical protein
LPNLKITCKNVQVVELPRTHGPYFDGANLLVTKVHGSETLFFGTAVVDLPPTAEQSTEEIHHSQ